MTLESLLIVWTIRLALFLLWLSVMICWLNSRSAADVTSQPGWLGRAVWVAGCLLAVAHVLAIFGLTLNWSHQAAVMDTARRTQQLIGIAFGGGVFFNYAFLLVWVLDAGWWCGWPERYRQRSQLWDVFIVGYLLFIAFNATVVFERGMVRWMGIAATVSMLAAGMYAFLERKRER